MVADIAGLRRQLRMVVDPRGTAADGPGSPPAEPTCSPGSPPRNVLTDDATGRGLATSTPPASTLLRHVDRGHKALTGVPRTLELGSMLQTLDAWLGRRLDRVPFGTVYACRRREKLIS